MKFQSKLLLVFLLGKFIAFPGQAQNEAYPVVIKSNPPGASIELVGDYTIIGQTPCHIRQETAGRFQLKVRKTGYEARNQFVDLQFATPNVFEIRLAPKTRWKAGLRSGLLPGWGQFYAEKPRKGLVVGAAFFSSLGILGYTAQRYQSKVDAYNSAREILSRPLDNTEYARQLQVVQEKGDAADQAFDLRQKWTWITSSIFIYNLLDVLFFFPNFELRGIRPSNLQLSLSSTSNATGCSLSILF